MRRWFTTHWPAPEDEKVVGTFDGVWVPEGKLHVIQDVAPGDLVWIYESATGPAEIREDSAGATKRVGRKRGRMGVIGLVQIKDPPTQPAESRMQHYVSRPSLWWRYFARAEPLNTGGFIPMPEAAALLGHKPTYNFRGYGGGSGLKQIDESTHERLFGAFMASSGSDLSGRLRTTFSQVRGGGGEGPDHLALKESIAANPSGFLEEPGLTLITVEMPFPTGDRIDVVLKDEFGRLVAVEVEVNCTADEICGPLQCMKYRALLAYRFDRDVREIRTILAARSVHRAVRQKCMRYGIEVVEIP